MAKPKWFLQGIAIMSVFLYSGDVGSDFWVGIDLYLRCHYHYAATVFTWILVPGFIYGWVIFFQGGVECHGKAILKALFFPILMIHYTLKKLVKAAYYIEHEDKERQAKE